MSPRIFSLAIAILVRASLLHCSPDKRTDFPCLAVFVE